MSMADPEHAQPAPAAEDGADAPDPAATPDLVKKTTHEIDSDDMFGMNGE